MDVLNKKSGVFGISKLSSDFRDLEEAMEQEINWQLQLSRYSVIVWQNTSAHMWQL